LFTGTPPAVGGCGGTLTGSAGNLTSPNYPGDFPENSHCVWYIKVPSGIVSLKFDDVDLGNAAGCVANLYVSW